MEHQNGDHHVWYIKNGVKALDLSSLPRCQAIAKTTGKECKRPAQKGLTVCGIHAGRYMPGAKAGNQNALVHGLFSREVKQQRAEACKKVRLMAHLSGALNSQVKSAGAEDTSFYQTFTKRSNNHGFEI